MGSELNDKELKILNMDVSEKLLCESGAKYNCALEENENQSMELFKELNI